MPKDSWDEHYFPDLNRFHGIEACQPQEVGGSISIQASCSRLGMARSQKVKTLAPFPKFAGFSWLTSAE
jgi:hypothetical protein